MQKEVELNIVILPPREIREAAIEMSRKLKEGFQTELTLNGLNSLPHMTLYQARFPENALEAVSAYLREIARKTSPFEVSLGGMSSFYRSVWWDVQPSSDITHLSKSIIYQLNPLREGLTVGFWKGGKWNMSETFSIENYGSVVIGDSFRPHVTITTLRDQRDVRPALDSMRPKVVKFVSESMHLALLGDMGRVTQVLEEFPFKGPSAYNLGPRNYF